MVELLSPDPEFLLHYRAESYRDGGMKLKARFERKLDDQGVINTQTYQMEEGVHWPNVVKKHSISSECTEKWWMQRWAKAREMRY